MGLLHRVAFSSSGRSTLVPDGATILRAAELASEPMRAECGGRGACGRCLVRMLEGEIPEYRVLRRDDGLPQALACLTPVHGPLTVMPLVEAQLPRLVSRDRNVGLAPLAEWAPWPLALEPIVCSDARDDLGVALDIGTTTLRLLLIRLSDGVIVGEAGAYNPQIARGADVISRIVAAEKGLLQELSASVRDAVAAMIEEAGAGSNRIRGYVVAGNITMIHLLLEVDPSGIRRVPSEPRWLDFPPVDAAMLGWPGAPLYSLPAAGGWVAAISWPERCAPGFHATPTAWPCMWTWAPTARSCSGGRLRAGLRVQRGARLRGRGHPLRHAGRPRRGGRGPRR
jgi:uncharacterized 2Fe-2S/4Fe-4S cluster protein (DUF4445 family)